MKRSLIVGFILSVLALVGVFSACNNDDDVSSGNTEIQNEIVLKYKEVNMKLYSEFEFVCFSQMPLSYSINDENIASIDENGIIKSFSAGETTISVTDGKINKTALLVVYDNYDLPDIQTNLDDEINLFIGNEIPLTAELYYCNNIVDVSIALRSLDNEIVKINEKGNLEALSLGTTEIVVSTTFYKQPIEKMITVNVVPNVQIIDASLSGYSLKTDETANIRLPNKVLVNDIEQDVTCYEFDETILTDIGSGRFSLKTDIDLGGKEATVIKAIYETGDEKCVFCFTVDIIYEEINSDLDVVVELVKNAIFKFELPDNGNITKVKLGAADLLYKRGTEHGTINGDMLYAGYNHINVYSSKGHIYKINAIGADYVIDDANEFVSVLGGIGSSVGSSSYIALSGDIKFDSNVVYHMSPNVFNGTLDGRGYTVSGLDLTKHNLIESWYAMFNGGSFIIKNIAFVDVNMSYFGDTRLHLCGNNINGDITLENCYLDFSNAASRAFAWTQNGNFTIKNTVLLRDLSNDRDTALFNTVNGNISVADVYLIAHDNAKLWGGYDGTHLTGTVTRNSDKATILAAIKASDTASDQLKTFANKYLEEHVVGKQNLVEKSATSSFLETLDINGETIASVFCGGTDLGYSAGTFNTSGLTHGEQTFKVVTTIGKVYAVKAIVADKTISDASEFVSVMGSITSGSTDYIALANDITFSGSETYVRANRFRGTLDGRGYTVDGLDLTKHGLSNSNYAMINGGDFTMKNIAFVNLNMATVNGTRVHLCGNTSWGVTIENCYLELLGNSVGLAWNHSDTFTIKDTVIVRNTASTVNALYKTETATTRVEDFYLVANDSALLWDGYVNNDTHLTGTVTRNSSKATILAAINASDTASDQLKTFANMYLI